MRPCATSEHAPMSHRCILSYTSSMPVGPTTAWAMVKTGVRRSLRRYVRSPKSNCTSAAPATGLTRVTTLRFTWLPGAMTRLPRAGTAERGCAVRHRNPKQMCASTSRARSMKNLNTPSKLPCANAAQFARTRSPYPQLESSGNTYK